MSTSDWRSIVAASLGWEQAHAGLDVAVDGFAPELRGRRPAAFPHSAWELLDHIRRTQHDLLAFMTAEHYEEPKWPDDYWPPTPEPPSDAAWDEALAAIRTDREALERFTREDGRDLTTRIPHGTGQTYLRTVLVAVDHASYHLGQIVAVRRLLGAWDKS
jgi:uncharacterized damage-inducible protein DinB